MQGWVDEALSSRLKGDKRLLPGAWHHYIVAPRLFTAALYILISANSHDDQASRTSYITMQGWMDEALSMRLKAHEPLLTCAQHHCIVVPRLDAAASAMLINTARQ